MGASPSYAVTWRAGDGPARAGKLELGPVSLKLAGGRRNGRLFAVALRYADVSSVCVVRGANGSSPQLLLERRKLEPVVITSLDGLGTAHELCELIGRRVAGTMST